jgi:hypothetical protein
MGQEQRMNIPSNSKLKVETASFNDMEISPLPYEESIPRKIFQCTALTHSTPKELYI